MDAMSNPEPITPQWTLADRLTKARDTAKLSQEQLGERIDVHVRTIRRYETDGYVPRKAVLLAWAMACGVSPQWLIGGPEDGDTTPVTIWKLSEQALKNAA